MYSATPGRAITTTSRSPVGRGLERGELLPEHPLHSVSRHRVTDLARHRQSEARRRHPGRPRRPEERIDDQMASGSGHTPLVDGLEIRGPRKRRATTAWGRHPAVCGVVSHLGREPGAALQAAPLDDRTTGLALHPLTKTVALAAAPAIRLVCALHEGRSCTVGSAGIPFGDRPRATIPKPRGNAVVRCSSTPVDEPVDNGLRTPYTSQIETSHNPRQDSLASGFSR